MVDFKNLRLKFPLSYLCKKKNIEDYFLQIVFTEVNVSSMSRSRSFCAVAVGAVKDKTDGSRWRRAVEAADAEMNRRNEASVIQPH